MSTKPLPPFFQRILAHVQQQNPTRFRYPTEAEQDSNTNLSETTSSAHLKLNIRRGKYAHKTTSLTRSRTQILNKNQHKIKKSSEQPDEAHEAIILKNSGIARHQRPHLTGLANPLLWRVRASHLTIHRPPPSSPGQAAPREAYSVLRCSRKLPCFKTHKFLLKI